MKRESAKHIAEERQRNVATRRKIFLKAKGWMLIKTIRIMVIISTSCATGREHDMGNTLFVGTRSSYGTGPP
jgi:predicted anti-sigma-YlaC factor YlaD